MGSYVNYIAFRERPDQTKLEALTGLGAFRLFERRGREEWYLEGQGSSEHEITFCDPLRFSGSGEAWASSQDVARRFKQDLRAADLRPIGLDLDRIAEAVLISQVLNCSLLLVYGNDDGVDIGIICADGQIEQARLGTTWQGRQIVYDADGLALRQARPGEPVTSQAGADEGADMVLDRHQFATEVANIFFGDTQRWRVTSDPTEFEATDYHLIQSAGTAPDADQGWQPAQRVIDPHLRDLLTRLPPGRERLRQVLRAMDLVLLPFLEERLISAERSEVKASITRCGALAASLTDIPGRSPVAGRLIEVTNLAYDYLRMLRPRPEYRRHDDIKNARVQLSAHWGWLKLALLFSKL